MENDDITKKSTEALIQRIKARARKLDETERYTDEDSEHKIQQELLKERKTDVDTNDSSKKNSF